MDGCSAESLQALCDTSGEGPPWRRWSGIWGWGTIGRQEWQAALVGSERSYPHQSAQRKTSRTQSAIPEIQKWFEYNSWLIFNDNRGRRWTKPIYLSLSMSTSDTKPQATERKENSLLGVAGWLLLDGGGLVVTDTTSIGRTPPRQSKKQQFKRRDSRRHMSYLRKGNKRADKEHYSNIVPTRKLPEEKTI